MIDWQKRQTNHWGSAGSSASVGRQFCLCFSLLCIDFISRVWSKKHSPAVCLKYLQENCKQRTTSGHRPVRGRAEKWGVACGEKQFHYFASFLLLLFVLSVHIENQTMTATES